mmetsp:Transcript_26889/g.40157  ORF Transcript_26889/g.40157 Transcript_26889/m.40157 type:complete len:115 (+) Transcript_26889:818-1162(+)
MTVLYQLYGSIVILVEILLHANTLCSKGDLSPLPPQPNIKDSAIFNDSLIVPIALAINTRNAHTKKPIKDRVCQDCIWHILLQTSILPTNYQGKEQDNLRDKGENIDTKLLAWS